jgi:hypothetical protein
MSGQGDRWTAEQVLALAPDAASRANGERLARTGPWSGTGAGEGAVWGVCRGSGRTPYRTVVDLAGGAGPAFRCSCPSRKFPCKHALGLLLSWAGGGSAVPDGGPAPDWAEEWVRARRERARAAAGGGDPEAPAGPGAAHAPADPEAARRRAERRSAAISAGAAELEQRLVDLLSGGLAGADHDGHTAWEETAARMVDAQAPGLASRVRELGAVAGSGGGWPERLLSECALLHLLSRGYQSLDALPEPLAATVRTRVGLTVEAASVLADEEARLRDEWLVLAQRDVEEGRLTARRAWLQGRVSGRLAVLLSFGAPGRPPQLTLPVGGTLDAEVSFYPGARPLRAALGRRHGGHGPGFPPGGGSTVTGGLAAYAAALCDDPWLDSWPVVLADVVPLRDEDGGWQVADAEGDAALPVAPGVAETGLWRLTALSGGRAVTIFGECGHRGFVPHTAWSPAEPARAVPL